MSDLEDVKRLVGEVLELHATYSPCPNAHLTRQCIIDTLAVLENMEEEIDKLIMDIEYHSLCNRWMILRRLKKLRKPPTEEPDTATKEQLIDRGLVCPACGHDKAWHTCDLCGCVQKDIKYIPAEKSEKEG